MLIDEVEITLKAGHGGAGKVSFYPGKKAGPDGGNGGRGGDIYLRVTSDLTALNQFSKTKELAAENGHYGESNIKTGHDGNDLMITMPIGTELTETETGKIIDLNDLDQKILIAKGGKGGKGNYELRSSRNTTPMRAQKGLPGEEKHFKIILKLIADFGFIGLPNAGKSSLLNELTAANVKVANYPFTTLEPNLGVFNNKIIADIPGLIEGAAEGKGLGIKFLKHIEKVSMLLHSIAADSEDVVGDYQTVIAEMKKFNPELMDKPEVILLTKSDLVSKDELKKKTDQLKKFKRKIYPVSIYDWDSLEKLKKILETAN
jgi:GTP-binding protein